MKNRAFIEILLSIVGISQTASLLIINFSGTKCKKESDVDVGHILYKFRCWNDC